jgi:hypothetical protein
MDTKVMKWMERLTCKDIAKKIDEMVIEDYAKEWKSRMVKSNTMLLIEEVFIIMHQFDDVNGVKERNKLAMIDLMTRWYQIENGLIKIYMNSLGQWYIYEKNDNDNYI